MNEQAGEGNLFWRSQHSCGCWISWFNEIMVLAPPSPHPQCLFFIYLKFTHRLNGCKRMLRLYLKCPFPNTLHTPTIVTSPLALRVQQNWSWKMMKSWMLVRKATIESIQSIQIRKWFTVLCTASTCTMCTVSVQLGLRVFVVVVVAAWRRIGHYTEALLYTCCSTSGHCNGAWTASFSTAASMEWSGARLESTSDT